MHMTLCFAYADCCGSFKAASRFLSSKMLCCWGSSVISAWSWQIISMAILEEVRAMAIPNRRGNFSSQVSLTVLHFSSYSMSFSSSSLMWGSFSAQNLLIVFLQAWNDEQHDRVLTCKLMWDWIDRYKFVVCWARPTAWLFKAASTELFKRTVSRLLRADHWNMQWRIPYQTVVCNSCRRQSSA